MTSRGFAFRLMTALGLAKKGFFIPYRYAGSVPGPRERAPYAAMSALMRSHQKDFRTVLAGIDGFASDLKKIGVDRPPAPRWNQDWFPRLDAAAAYTLIRVRAPRRIVEVGSGHSTRFLSRALLDDGSSALITAIDPAPRAAIEGLENVELLRTPLHNAGLGPFESLQSGDVLFIDSSHILMPGTDVDMLFNRVLPALPSGVLIHVHDVFLPDDYPVEWNWRGYNEQLAVAAMLGAGGYSVVFASHYVSTRMNLSVDSTVLSELPLLAGAQESSLWLRKS